MFPFKTFASSQLQLAEGVGNVQVSVKHSKKDYYNYQPKDNTDYTGTVYGSSPSHGRLTALNPAAAACTSMYLFKQTRVWYVNPEVASSSPSPVKFSLAFLFNCLKVPSQFLPCLFDLN